MKKIIPFLFLLATSSFAADAVVAKRFTKVDVQKIVSAKIQESVMETNGKRAVVRVAVELQVEGNMGFCDFKDFASALDYRWYEDGRPIYLSVISTACPTPKPLDLVLRGYTQQSEARTITTSFDLDLYDKESQTIVVQTGYDARGKSEINVSFANRKVTVKNTQ